jgi:hypothetical protein
VRLHEHGWLVASALQKSVSHLREVFQIHTRSRLEVHPIAAGTSKEMSAVQSNSAAGSLQEKLLADTPHLEQEPEPPAAWPVVRFIVKSPMQCSSLRSFLTLFLGILSSVGVGGCLAGIGSFIGQLTTALKNANDKDFDRSFLILCIFLVAAVATKTCSEYCMRSLGQLKRTHLNSRIQSM